MIVAIFVALFTLLFEGINLFCFAWHVNFHIPTNTIIPSLMILLYLLTSVVVLDVFLGSTDWEKWSLKTCKNKAEHPDIVYVVFLWRAVLIIGPMLSFFDMRYLGLCVWLCGILIDRFIICPYIDEPLWSLWPFRS